MVFEGLKNGTQTRILDAIYRKRREKGNYISLNWVRDELGVKSDAKDHTIRNRLAELAYKGGPLEIGGEPGDGLYRVTGNWPQNFEFEFDRRESEPRLL